MTTSVCVFDMADLRLVRRGYLACLHTGSGELLATLDTSGEDFADLDEREVLFEAFDEALGSSSVTRPGHSDALVVMKVGLYNPYTAEVAVGCLPHTRAYGDLTPLPVAPDGRCMAVSNGGGVLADAHRTLGICEPDRSRLPAVWDAHQVY